MTTSKIIFYDVLSALNPPFWSSNALRTRLALNFLKLEYETVFLSYPDIEPTFSQLGLEPSNPPPYDKRPKYTLPAIQHGDTWVGGSFDIAVYLAKQFPPTSTRPALFPGNTIALARLTADYLDEKILVHARKLVLSRVPTWLDDRGAAYFRETRQKWFGVPLDEYYTDEEERTKIRADVVKGFDGLAKLLKDEPSGPFLQGELAGYSDLQIMAVMSWIKRGDPESWEAAIHRNPDIKALYDACEQWLR